MGKSASPVPFIHQLLKNFLILFVDICGGSNGREKSLCKNEAEHQFLVKLKNLAEDTMAVIFREPSCATLVILPL